MGKHIIFVFSGTGNSLWAAKEISKELEHCVIVSMGKTAYSLEGGYETIGFVYPTYYRGIPHQVQAFIANLDLQSNSAAYIYAIATCGKASCGGNSIVQVNKRLAVKGIALHYAEHLDMFSNYVIMYDMRDTAQEEAVQSAIDLQPMLDKIKNRSANKLGTTNEPFQQLAYQAMMLLTPTMDKNFNVSDACITCGICGKVCPVDNIVLGQDGKPHFKHHCEQCLACIQHCPTKAINYKDKTQTRRRYTHPDISWKELAQLHRDCKITP